MFKAVVTGFFAYLLSLLIEEIFSISVPKEFHAIFVLIIFSVALFFYMNPPKREKEKQDGNK